jgi:hypothetical protein
MMTLMQGAVIDRPSDVEILGNDFGSEHADEGNRVSWRLNFTAFGLATRS